MRRQATFLLLAGLALAQDYPYYPPPRQEARQEARQAAPPAQGPVQIPSQFTDAKTLKQDRLLIADPAGNWAERPMVSETGEIQVGPHKVQVLGLTPSQIESALGMRGIQARVANLSAGGVAVLGEVLVPGVYEGGLRLTRAVAQARPLPSANLAEVRIVRRDGTTQKVNLERLLSKGEIFEDSAVWDGDTIYIPAKAGQKAWGAVKDFVGFAYNGASAVAQGAFAADILTRK